MNRLYRFAPRYGAILSMLTVASFAHGHGVAEGEATGSGRAIEFPDTAEYLTLVADLHTHSVFSDGHVWPRIRIGEALRDGLDAIAITEHLEYQPHLPDIPHPDRNRSFEESVVARGESDLMVVAGSEITRGPPAGHMNAIFISDANKLLQLPDEDITDPGAHYEAADQWPAQQAVEAANAQGAFVFWNHPFFFGDTIDGIARMNDFHRGNARRGLLHGIEIANGDWYSEEAFQIALDHDLTLMGVSDVHDLIDWDHEPHAGGHRPVNLIFTKQRTQEAMQAALFEGRTVVWFRNLLIGRPEHLQPLLSACLSVGEADYRNNTQILTVPISNHSDASFLLENTSNLTFVHTADLLEIPPHETVEVPVKTGDRVDAVTLKFRVMNALVAPKQHPGIEFSVTVGGATNTP